MFVHVFALTYAKQNITFIGRHKSTTSQPRSLLTFKIQTTFLSWNSAEFYSQTSSLSSVNTDCMHHHHPAASTLLATLTCTNLDTQMKLLPPSKVQRRVSDDVVDD